jgi:hypothetical protein
LNLLPQSELLEQAHQQWSEFVLIPEAKTSLAHVNGKPGTTILPWESRGLPQGVLLAKLINDEADAWEVNS